MPSGAIVLESGVIAHEGEESFSAFVSLHRERARRLAWRLVGGDEAAAEDIAQDAFIKAYRNLKTFRGEASLETWFYRILVRQAQDYRRWRAVRTLWHNMWAQEPQAEERDFGDPGLRHRITAALERLSRRQREIFILVHFEGFTVQECADLLKKSVGTVKSHLHRALVTLREELADLQELQGEVRP
jgi:RNA polymerase sigma-70 factor (ECF subfamily)